MKLRINLVRLWAAASMGLVLAVILFLFGFVFRKGLGAISWEFLTEAPGGLILGTEGGIWPAILGSLYYTGIACAFASVLGIGCAVYQVYYVRSARVREAISMIMQCMAGVPSIVLGLFGYSLLVRTLGWGKCLMAGGITQGIMILPFIQVRAEKALREADQALVRASYALGASRSHTLRRIVLPQTAPQLVSAVILGGCYAMGAAAPLIFTGAVIMAKAPETLWKPAMALPYHLYMLLTQGTSEQNAYGTACVLMLVVLITNTAATLFAWRRRK